MVGKNDMHASDSAMEGKDTVATILFLFFKGGGWGLQE